MKTRDELAAEVMVALRFAASGLLMSPDGHRYASLDRDGYMGDAAKDNEGFFAVVHVLATSRAHAERIVAAGLAAMKAVK